MAAQAQSTLEKIALAEAASKSGLLANYGPAKLLNEQEPKLPTSWGPAMRSSRTASGPKLPTSWGPAMRK